MRVVELSTSPRLMLLSLLLANLQPHKVQVELTLDLQHGMEAKLCRRSASSRLKHALRQLSQALLVDNSEVQEPSQVGSARPAIVLRKKAHQPGHRCKSRGKARTPTFLTVTVTVTGSVLVWPVRHVYTICTKTGMQTATKLASTIPTKRCHSPNTLMCGSKML